MALRTRRSVLRLIGLGTVTAPALPVIAARAVQPVQKVVEQAPKVAEAVKRARIDMFLLRGGEPVRVGERVMVEHGGGLSPVPRIAGVVEQVEIEAEAGALTMVRAVVRVDPAVRAARDVTMQTRAVATWTDDGIVQPTVARVEVHASQVVAAMHEAIRRGQLQLAGWRAVG